MSTLSRRFQRSGINEKFSEMAFCVFSNNDVYKAARRQRKKFHRLKNA